MTRRDLIIGNQYIKRSMRGDFIGRLKSIEANDVVFENRSETLYTNIDRALAEFEPVRKGVTAWQS